MNTLGKVSLILSAFCLFATMGFRLALPGAIPFLEVGLGFSLFFLLFGLVSNFQYLRTTLRSESSQFVFKSLVSVVLTFCILVAGNYIFSQKRLWFDWTDNKIHSLSPLSAALVKALPEPLVFHYFHVDSAQVRELEAQVRQALDPYMALSHEVQLETHSVFERPDLAKEFRVGDEESTLYVKYKGRIERLSGIDEKAITNVLLKVTKEPKQIYFVEGSDSRSITETNTFGLSGIKDQLERLHYNVARLDNLKSVPEDAAMLVMVGPRRGITAETIQVLETYLNNGGTVLIAADPGEDHNLNPFLEKFGLQISGDFMFAAQAKSGPNNLLVATHRGRGQHAIAKGLRDGQNPKLFIASDVRATLESPHSQVVPILDHLPTTVARVDISPDSEQLPMMERYAAMISEGIGDKSYKLVVVADSDFLTNQFYTYGANFDFAINTFSYLSEDEDILKIKPAVAKTTYLVLSQTQMNLYYLFFVLPFAALFLVAGAFLRLRRMF